MQKKNHPHTLHLKHVAELNDEIWGTRFSRINLVIGVIVALLIGFMYARYIRDLHENDMWFSNIKEIEREISFRTEAGLYFSYYKNLVLSPSIMQGMRKLINDNKTEHRRTINILNRFNVYQEVILATIYKTLNLQAYMEYVYFYINVVFGLHGMYMVALYVMSWLISGSWIAGVLSTFFYIFNKTDTTRVYFTIPLRESFSLPFIYLHLASITLYLKSNTSTRSQTGSLVVTAVGTFFTILTWQFAQFVLLLESFALFGMWCLDMTSKRKVQNVLFTFVGCLIAVCILQFNNDMLLSSLCLHFCLAALVILQIVPSQVENPGFIRKSLKLCLVVGAVLAVTFVLNIGIKTVTRVDSDEHIFKFVLAKLGYGEALKRDFDSLLYLCDGSFQYLPADTIVRLTDGVVFPCYVIAVVVSLIVLAISVVLRWRFGKEDEHPWMLQNHPEIAFTVILTVFFGVVAASTLRMKYLWTPHVCVVAAGLFCHQYTWRWIFYAGKIKEGISSLLGYFIPIALIVVLLWKRLPGAMEELKSLKEFYDPDTVELMTWINDNTGPSEAFTGSMQLLAGVKLCTDRPITNHPHYENKFLRQRTKEVYQIYARKSPKAVVDILKKHGSNYIILENSICYSKQEDGCRLVDILDIDNGNQVMPNPSHTGPGHMPRFCHAIKYDATFLKYFKKMFENRTFYLYKLL